MSKGRPVDPKQQEKMQRALLDALRELLAVKSFKSITIREIASNAGTQSAMISYYFGNKTGLLKALLSSTAREREALLQEMFALVLKDPHNAFDILVNHAIPVLLRDPWLFRLFQEEVILGDSELKQFILEQFPQIAAGVIGKLLRHLQQQGFVHKDINIQFSVASIMGAVGFPIMSQPLLKEAAGIDLETIASDEWKQHLSLQFKRAFCI